MSTRPPKKPPRRTAERILDVSLALFNRFGEPNVSTTLISNELGISPGNLYYHYPAKDELIYSLFERHARQLDGLLRASDGVAHVEDAWLFFHMLFESLWEHRFLYRDLNDLLSKNRKLETAFQALMAELHAAVRALLGGLARHRLFERNLEPREADATAHAMVVVLCYWLSYEYVRDPRRALEPEVAGAAMLRGAYHVLSLLMPYLMPAAREHLLGLVDAYRSGPPRPTA